MPAGRGLAENLARTLAELYGRAAEQMAAAVALRLHQDLAHIDRPDWAERQMLAMEALHEQSLRIVDRLNSEMAEAVEQMVVLAAERGSVEALRELQRLGFGLPSTLADIRRELPGAEAVQRLAYSLTSTLQGTHLRITRWPEDIYRQVTSRASADVLLGTHTRRQAAQRMWEELLANGVTGFVDRAGRAWRLESYVDMASRTIAAQAAVEAHMDRLGEAGIDLVICSDAPEECERCRPWEGQVLARTGGGGARTVEMEHAIRDGEMVRVHIAGSVDEAIGAGLMHPNCRHSLSGYFPGLTSPRGDGDLPEPSPQDRWDQLTAGLDPDAPGERLTGGASSDTTLVQTPAGPVVRKRSPSWDDQATGQAQADAEYLAAQMAEALGVRTPRVARAGDDAVWMEWIGGASPAPDGWVNTPDGQRMGLLDMLSLNVDRNGGNVLTDSAGNLWGIDHGAAWQMQEYLDSPLPANSPGVGWFVDANGGYVANPLSAADVALLRGRLEALRPTFASAGRESWLDYSLGVLRNLGQHATGGGLYG